MKHLYFVRHGLSEMNKLKQWGGADTPLAQEGHEQAKLTAQQIKDADLAVDVIISSPLPRALDTAKHIATAIDYPEDKIIQNDLFVERLFGDLEGTKDQKVFDEYLIDESSIDKIQGVERMTDLQWRAQKALDYLKNLPNDNILVVSHGAFGRALRRAVVHGPLNERGPGINNAELIKFI